MDNQAPAVVTNPRYLLALNVQNALGYEAHWRVYEAAIGRDRRSQLGGREACAYVGQQVFLAVLGATLDA